MGGEDRRACSMGGQDTQRRPDPHPPDRLMSAGYTLFTQEGGRRSGWGSSGVEARPTDGARQSVALRAAATLALAPRPDEAARGVYRPPTREAIRAAVELEQRFVDATLDQLRCPLDRRGSGWTRARLLPSRAAIRGGRTEPRRQAVLDRRSRARSWPAPRSRISRGRSTASPTSTVDPSSSRDSPTRST